MPKYFAFYKPFQVLSQFSSDGNKACLADYCKVAKDVYPIGRLDYDSEGLLLLSNDKSLNHQLLNPQFAHWRTYWVQVEGVITQEAMAKLQQGITIQIDGKPHKCLPAKVQILQEEIAIVPPRNPPVRFRSSIPTTWISLSLQEGKNRQVRRMTAAVGFPTLRLIRMQIEQLTLGKLQPGELMELSQKLIYQKILGK